MGRSRSAARCCSFRFRQMPSRQERRKADRDVAKASAKAGFAGSAAAQVHEDPDGDWTVQTDDCGVLLRALGADAVKQLAEEGNRAAQFSQGYKLMSEAESDAGFAGGLGASGRSPKADVGLSLYIDTFPAAHQTEVVALMWSPGDLKYNLFAVPTLGGGGQGAPGEGGRARARARYVDPGECSRHEKGVRTSRGMVHEGRRGRVAESDALPRARSGLGAGRGGAGPPGGGGLVQARGRRR